MIDIAQAAVCTKCGVEQPLTDFYRQTGKPNGRHSWCKHCFRAKQSEYRSTEAGKRSAERRASEGRGAAATRKYRYGLSIADLNRMLAEQGGACAVCGDRIDMIHAHVDHDHSCCARRKSCGRCVRSLTCKYCNLMLGYAYDQPERLMSAAAYLVRHQETSPNPVPADDTDPAEPGEGEDP